MVPKWRQSTRFGGVGLRSGVPCVVLLPRGCREVFPLWLLGNPLGACGLLLRRGSVGTVNLHREWETTHALAWRRDLSKKKRKMQKGKVPSGVSACHRGEVHFGCV